MEKKPTKLTLCHLEVVVLPSGAVIANYKTIGTFKELKNNLIERKLK